MNRILSVDAAAGVAVAQAGVVLEALDNALAEQGLCVPLDLGAKGSCQIGALTTDVTSPLHPCHGVRADAQKRAQAAT